MRLGAQRCLLEQGSTTQRCYGSNEVFERHRHRYEFNNSYLQEYEKAGMQATGINPKSNLVEVIEIDHHPWFVGVQFHPEYKSTVSTPHPLFVYFVKACLNHQK